jgi:protease I
MELNGRKVIVLVGPSFEDSELLVPMYRMREAGAEVTLAGLGERTYHGKHGYPVTVDGPCESFTSTRWDAVLVPGGWAPDKIRTNAAALEIVRQTAQRGGVVAAICHAGWVLASADVIRGRRVTSYHAIKDDMLNAGGQWEDTEVVIDGPLITSRTPDDLPAFCRSIVQAMARQTAAV